MKKIDLGQTITILANIGVIAGIVFLGFEIRNDADQAGVFGLQEGVSQLLDWQNQITGDEEIAEIYISGLADYQTLSRTEKARFDSLMRSWIHIESALISSREIIGRDRSRDPADRLGAERIRLHLDQPGFRQWWESTDRRGLPNQGIRLIDELASGASR